MCPVYLGALIFRYFDGPVYESTVLLVFLRRKNHKEMFYKHLRKVREMKDGAELKAELHKLTLWIDEDPKLFTADILYNILLSYRDIQVCVN